MAVIIRIILRAVCLLALSSAYLDQSPPLASTWQNVQFSPREAAKKPMVSMNSFTEMPRRTWTFLKYCSAINGFCADSVWPPVRAATRRQTTAIPMVVMIVRRNPGLNLCPPLALALRSLTGHHAGKEFLGFAPRNCERGPLSAPVLFCQVTNLPHVIGIVRHLPVDGLCDGMSFGANIDSVAQMLLG